MPPNAEPILFLVRSLEYGGAERQLIVLAAGLAQRGYAVSVVVFYGYGALESELEKVGVRCIHLEKHGRWDVFPFLFRLRKVLRDVRPALLHSYMDVPNLLTILFKPLLPETAVIWGLRASSLDWTRYDWLSRVVWWLECRLSRIADLSIANSQAGKKHAVASGFPQKSIRVIPNGIDTRRYRFDPEARARMREAWGLHAKTPLIGLTARLDPMKDHDTFLRAAARLIQSQPEVRFVCIGDGPADYRQELLSLADTLGLSHAMVWAGTVDNMAAAYSALDIAVSASRFGEGFSNAIAEAMACERACVVTDVGDSAWIVGDTGLVVPAGDAPSLTLAMARLADMDTSQRMALGTTARVRVEAEFSVERLLDSTLDAFERAACA